VVYRYSLCIRSIENWLAHNNARGNDSIASVLDSELKELSHMMGQGFNLKVKWSPKADSNIEGEVKGDIIWIYSTSRENAVRTLHHEFMDWMVVEAIKPYEEMINLHRTLLNAVFKYLQESSYNRKEAVVESLCSLLSDRLSKEIRAPDT